MNTKEFLLRIKDTNKLLLGAHTYISEYELENNNQRLSLVISKLASSMTEINFFIKENMNEIKSGLGQNQTTKKETTNDELSSKGSKESEPRVSEKLVQQKSNNSRRSSK